MKRITLKYFRFILKRFSRSNTLKKRRPAYSESIAYPIQKSKMAPGLGIVLGIGLYVGPIGMVYPF